jgi:hypothetical protein
VTIEGPAGSGGGGGAEGGSKTFFIDFADTFTPKPGSNGQKSYTKTIGIPAADWTFSADSPLILKLENGAIAGWSRNDTTDTIFITLIMQAKKDDQASDFLALTGKVSGKRLVEDSVTKVPIQNASVTIHWSTGDEGPLYTAVDGYFSFWNGVKGETANLTITKTGYDDLDSTIAISHNVSDTVSDIMKYLPCAFSIKLPCRWLI